MRVLTGYGHFNIVLPSYLIFELEVTAGPLLGDEQQVVEEEEVPLLALQTLQRETRDVYRNRRGNSLRSLNNDPFFAESTALDMEF